MTEKRCPYCGTILEPKEDLFAGMRKPDRERIRDILIDILADGKIPESDFLLRPFEKGVDALVLEFRAIEGKRRLDADLTSKIIAAIRLAYEENGGMFPFKGVTTPTAPVIGCIVEAGRRNKARAAGETTEGRQQKYASYPGVES